MKKLLSVLEIPHKIEQKIMSKTAYAQVVPSYGDLQYDFMMLVTRKRRHDEACAFKCLRLSNRVARILFVTQRFSFLTNK